MAARREAEKTTLAEALAKRVSLPYFTLDHVTSVIAPYIPEREYVTKLPLRVARQETNYSNDVFYAKYSTGQIVDFYLCQAETFWPGVESFIKYAIDEYNFRSVNTDIDFEQKLKESVASIST